MLSRTALTPGLVLPALLSACSHSATDVIVKGTTKNTTGQEMVDLQRALDQGAITQDEFSELKERIIRRNEVASAFMAKLQVGCRWALKLLRPDGLPVRSLAWSVARAATACCCAPWIQGPCSGRARHSLG